MLQFAKIHTYFDLVKIIFSEVRCLRKKTYFCKLIMRKKSHKTLLYRIAYYNEVLKTTGII